MATHLGLAAGSISVDLQGIGWDQSSKDCNAQPSVWASNYEPISSGQNPCRSAAVEGHA